jgi:hypothetical protein
MASGLIVPMRDTEKGGAMNDVIYLGLALGFFALSWAFIRLCDRL